jgi:RNA polymerase sigma-70 factor, ECF subfamily
MSINKWNDQELVSNYIKGNELAFEILLERHKDRIYHYALKMVKSVAIAEDIFQEALFKAIITIKKGKYNEEGKFLPWIMRITHNLAIDHFRLQKKFNKISETSSKNEDFNIFDLVKTEEKTVEDVLIHEEILGDAVGLLKDLSEEQRGIINMRIFQGMSFKDISEQEGISINTALGRMRYALINLRRLAERSKVVLTLD